jgi:hypothetical protein
MFEVTVPSCTKGKITHFVGAHIVMNANGPISRRTHVKGCQRSAESREFFSGAPVSFHREGWQGALG